MTVSTAMSTAMSANMAVDVQGRTSGLNYVPRADAATRAPRPGPLKVEPADPAVHIQNLSDEEQTVTHTRDLIVAGSISSSETPPAVTSSA